MRTQCFKEKYGRGWLTKFNAAKRAYIKSREPRTLHQIYFLPKENYCGLSTDVERRLKEHKYYHKRNVDGCEILYETYSRLEAFRIERLIQHHMGYKGMKSTHLENF